MKHNLLAFCAAASLWGCQAADDGSNLLQTGGSGGSTSTGGSATGGTTASGGSATGGTTASGGATSGNGGMGAVANASGSPSTSGAGGTNAGGMNAAGTNNAGGGNGGRASFGGRAGAGGARGGAQNSSGGAGNGGGAGSGNGGSATAGSAGACAQNIACKLDPAPTSGDIHQDCVDRVNQFRTQCACLPALARWTDGEACADQMAEYDSTAPEAHAGFMDNICPGGSEQDECPGYRSNAQVISTCIQQMWDEGPPPTSSCTGSCYEMYGHFINMTNTKVTKVACGFFTTPDGKVWSVQNFSR